MVSKITLIEPHFDGAQFGPTSIPGDELDHPASETTDVRDETDESTGTSRSRWLLAAGLLALVAVLGVVAARRSSGTLTGDADVEADAESEDADEIAIE